MNPNIDQDILEDFLLEAGEILEHLNEQLVEMENTPEDMELLNSIFRGYHTIKGGAGFLGAEALVAVCHRCEDIFNLLRSQKLSVTAELMDVILQGYDSITEMFEALNETELPSPADEGLIQSLDRIVAQQESSDSEPKSDPPSESSSTGPASESEVGELLETAAAGKDDIADDEFQAMLDEMHGAGNAPGVAPAATSDSEDMSDDEFQAMLDEMHGKGNSPGIGKEVDLVAPQPAPAVSAEPAKVETAKAPEKASKPGTKKEETTLRVETARLDKIMNMVGELVLVRNRLMTLRSADTDGHMTTTINNLDLITGDLQDAVMKTRMQPVKKIFGRFPRVVRDLSRTLKKDIELVLEGEETDLDKNLIQALADPLVHLVRNSVDHGIEMPDVREAAGKPRLGTIVLSASQAGEFIILSIRDDGKGMDPDVLRAIAVKKGVMDQNAAAALTDNECFNLIFAAGFSTKSEISDISGRGVGMDVVKTSIQKVNGVVTIESQLGKGTEVIVKVPLTLAILPTLMVDLGGQVFAFPLGLVVETLDISSGEVRVVDGQRVLLLRQNHLPLVMLNEWLDKPSPDIEKTGQVVVLSIGTKKVGFVVEHLIGQEEVVIKPLGSLVKGLDGFSGATITGDGHIALVLDIPSLIKRYG